MSMQRRGFLASILAAGVAPAFAGSGVLMPVRQLIMPPPVPWQALWTPLYVCAGDTVNFVVPGGIRRSIPIVRAGAVIGADHTGLIYKTD